ncbi:uncharacterized protein LOC119172017 isoform X2 [Rhipicephalus microplus]|uniref:uncharacterized protein LOC119172017 isoform X2 n=1 Tax=Rhipicephalus microplus TaxID=6941 RepID=UPI003F6C9F9A
MELCVASPACATCIGSDQRGVRRRRWVTLFLLLVTAVSGVLGVVVTEVRLLSDSNKTQYVLQGEGATLLCFFVLSPGEDLRRVLWFKDGAEVYVWRKGRRPLARNLFDKRVDLSNRSPSFITILSAHMSMQGNYTCKVETDLGTSQNDFFLTVIVDSCKEDSWTTFSDRVSCTETVELDCGGMFPKPSPACGVYNDQTGVYLNTVPFDRVEPAANSTYEVRLHRVFQVRDWLTFRNLTFRCHIIVLGTDWRSGITHKLFGDAGCPPEPPEIVNGYYNVSGEDTCWRTPSEGSVTRYYCLEGFELRGPRELVCRNGSWVVPSPLLTSLGPQQVPPAGRPFKNIICEINGQAKVGWNTLLTAITTTLPAMMCLYLTSSST